MWEKLLEEHPNFSETYLYIMDAEKQLGMDASQREKQFTENLSRSTFYSESEKRELLAEINN
jgi:hypothetical protein